MNDLIARAAEYVGWWVHMPGEKRKSGHPAWAYEWGEGVDESDLMYPETCRHDLHALTGLVEDKVRGEVPDLVLTQEQGSANACLVGTVDDKGVFNSPGPGFHKDWLYARLGALMALADQLGEGE